MIQHGFIMTRGLSVVLAGWCAAAVVLGPFQSAPFVDDWVYAWSVENLLATGRLEVLDISSNLVHAQALWGALFCLPFGFSFAALRLSTWVLAMAAIIGVHRLLREADADESAATFGAATLAVYPPFLVLSCSFMTDVPLLAVETWALVFFLRAYRRLSSHDLWMGTGLSVIAAGIRWVGLVPACAMAAALLCDSRGWGRARARFLIPATALLMAAGVAWTLRGSVHEVADLSDLANTPQPRLAALQEYAVALLPAWLPLSVEFMAVGLGLAAAPVALALVPLPGQRRRLFALSAAGALVVAAGHITGGLHYPAFASEGTWIPDELGAVATLLPGWTPIAVPPEVTFLATLLCWVSALVIASSVAARGPHPSPLWWTMTGLLLMTAVLWLATDRYILAFVPPALALALGRKAQVSWLRGAVALSLFACIGLVGVRDRLSAERALWSAVDDLRAGGVPVARIDAGYVVNGWLQYAHPDQAHRDEAGRVAVPFVNGDAEVPWVVAAAPLPDTEVVRAYSFRRTWRTPGRMFVLRRPDPPGR